ncbi:hypothetical protein Vafri_21173, partial [Volvox africanus]
VVPATSFKLFQLYRTGGLRPPSTAEAKSPQTPPQPHPTTDQSLGTAPPAAPLTPPRVHYLSPAIWAATNTTSWVDPSSHVAPNDAADPATTAADADDDAEATDATDATEATTSTIPCGHVFIGGRHFLLEAPLPVPPIDLDFGSAVPSAFPDFGSAVPSAFPDFGSAVPSAFPDFASAIPSAFPDFASAILLISPTFTVFTDFTLEDLTTAGVDFVWI